MPYFQTTNKKGMSLVEMLVAIFIVTAVTAGFTLFFIQSWKSNAFIMEEGTSSVQASNSIRKIAKDLRGIRQSETGEYLIKEADENELVVYFNADADDNVERVRYYVDESSQLLKAGIAEAGGSPLAYPADYSADSVTSLASYVMNGALSEPVFKYYDNTNSELASPVSNLTDIRLIEVNLWINMKPNIAPDNVKMSTSVELRNLDEGI